jgi:hypothetical protein
VISITILYFVFTDAARLDVVVVCLSLALAVLISDRRIENFAGNSTSSQ